MLDKILENVLNEIENSPDSKLTAQNLAKTANMSAVHLQRLFRLVFGRSLASYIRSRRLAASLECLLRTDYRIIDIAEEYGFNYEQSFIRAFKREFGLTPGQLRLGGHFTKVMPPLQLSALNKTDGGLFFGPEFVMVPQFHLVGKRHTINRSESLEKAPEAAKDFWFNYQAAINDKINEYVYIGLTRRSDGADFSYYMPSVQVSKVKKLPAWLDSDTFPASLCARFQYIGQNHYLDFNRTVARDMYKAIKAYANSVDAKYRLLNDQIYFERIDMADYDGIFSKIEWFTPVVER